MTRPHQRLSAATTYAAAHGWKPSRTNGGHIAWRKDGRVVFGSSTPSDRRAVWNVVAKMKRMDREVG